MNYDAPVEYVVTEELLDGAYHERENPWRKPMSDNSLISELSEKIII